MRSSAADEKAYMAKVAQKSPKMIPPSCACSSYASETWNICSNCPAVMACTVCAAGSSRWSAAQCLRSTAHLLATQASDKLESTSNNVLLCMLNRLQMRCTGLRCVFNAFDRLEAVSTAGAEITVLRSS